MRKAVRLVIALAFIAGVSVQVVARADTFPVVASGGGPHKGWTGIQWTNAPGAQGVLTVVNNNVSGPGFATLYLYDATNHALAGASVAVIGNLEDVHVQANLPPLPPAEHVVVTPRSAQYGAEVNITFDSSLPAGTYKAMFVAGGDGFNTGWNWSLNGNSAVGAPTATTSGTDVYAYSSKDFTGTASAQAYAGAYSVSSSGAAVNVGTQKSITATHTLLGIGFFGPGTGVRQMTMDGPTGSRTCNCAFSDVTGPDAVGPGTWTFQYTGAGAGPSNFSDMILGAADAYLP